MKPIIALSRYFEPVLIIAAVSLLTLLIFVQVMLRPFDASLPWAEELARYLFVWAIYLSISYAIKDRRHIRITILVDRLKPAGQLFFVLLADVIFLLYSAAVVYFGFIICQRSLELGQIAPAMEIPVVLLYASVVIGSLLNIARLLASMTEHCRRFGKEELLRSRDGQRYEEVQS